MLTVYLMGTSKSHEGHHDPTQTVLVGRNASIIAIFFQSSCCTSLAVWVHVIRRFQLNVEKKMASIDNCSPWGVDSLENHTSYLSLKYRRLSFPKITIRRTHDCNCKCFFQIVNHFKRKILSTTSAYLPQLFRNFNKKHQKNWGNSVVLSVAVLGIVSAGVHHTGVIDAGLLSLWELERKAPKTHR